MKFWVVFSFCALLSCTCCTGLPNGFNAEAIASPGYSQLYALHYTDIVGTISKGIYCELDGEQARTYGYGSDTPHVESSVLIPAQLDLHISRCEGRTTESAVGAVHRLLNSFTFPSSISIQRLAIVVIPSHVTPDLYCTVMAFEAYNNATSMGHSPIVDSVFFLKGGTAWSESRLTFEYIAEAKGKRSSIGLYGFDTVGASLNEWEAVVARAEFNQRRWEAGHLFPYHVVERAPMMSLGKTATEKCSAGPSFTYAPLGGLTTWASTSDTRWQWDTHKSSFSKKTEAHSIALLVSSTSFSIESDHAPAADSSASGIVATLAIAEAIKRQGKSPITVFFFPGEHFGAVGSSRFIQDSHFLECEQMGLEACTSLAYQEALNFTTVDFSQFDTIIALDQLAYGKAGLYYHIDSRADLDNNNALQNAKKVLEKHGVYQSSTTSLDHSPATTLVDWAAKAGIPLSQKVMLTFSRYCDVYQNKHVYLNSDLARGDVSYHPIEEASNVILRLLSNDEDASVDGVLLSELWHCLAVNRSCSLLAEAGLPQHAPDHSVRLFTTQPSFSELILAAALKRCGFTPIFTPAVSPRLAVGQTWGPQWNVSLVSWTADQGGRYSMHVARYIPAPVGLRIASVGSPTQSVCTLVLSLMACFCLAFAAHFCAY